MKQCLQKVQQLHCHLACDDHIKALAQASSENNENTKELTLNNNNIPSERILSSPVLIPKSKTVYLRMEKLCSSELRDVKKLLELTSNDYGLNELFYIPSIANSPFLFASKSMNQSLTEVASSQDVLPPAPFFVPWGFVENQDLQSLEVPCKVENCQRVLQNVVDKPKDHEDGIFHVTKLVTIMAEKANDNPHEYFDIDRIMLNVILAELLRKIGYLEQSLDIFINCHKELSESTFVIDASLFKRVRNISLSQLRNSLLINASVCSLQLGREKECFGILDYITPEDDLLGSYHQVCVQSTLGSALASMGQYPAALSEVENGCQMLSKILPPNHSVLSSIFNQMGIVLASNKKYELAIT